MLPIEFFYKTARAQPDSPAVIDGDRTLSYLELQSRVDALAYGLQDIDPAPLSRVGICAYNHVDHVIAWLATLAAEKTWVPLYPTSTASDLETKIRFTQASIVVADQAGLAKLGILDATVVPMGDAGHGTDHLTEQHLGRRPRRTYPSLNDTQAIKFTGGTTGAPKGVMQPFRAWNTNIVTQIQCYGLCPGDRYLTAAPITHGTSTYLMPTFAVGGTVVLTDRPKPEQTLDLMRRWEITTIFVPATVIYMMLANLGGAAPNTPALRNLIYGAGPVRPGEIARAQAAVGPVVASTYGQTEAPQIATHIKPDELMDPDRRASVGRPTLLTDVRTMDADGRICRAGEEGEVVIRGDLVMSGYWRQPEKTAETIRDGWLRTGDIGVFDDQGFLFLKGRLKDMIITGGFNVYPADVEPVIGEHPAVRDVAVFGAPDPKWGERVVAAVQLAEGRHASPEELIKFTKERIGSVMAPKDVRFYAELPRNAYGKLQKQTLIDDLGNTESSP